ncbi:aldose 1-epimerase family protein [Selenomonas caprae]|uniref:Aldose 1-epimerase family protein n=1 Tax=Selenomonas caprae TaxID=2606905 RepID=A0A5D6WI86_9FIRM|nr:aldose 1-epimerase family protein [Selenomonas caprae]TYZ27192.1 aldose 1-epimerase family protein [Selenomonas caprae]
MLYTLENETLCVLVRSHGAELRSIKERADETEYLWDGNPEWWKYSSPVLFPIVGKLRDGKYRVSGTEYELPGHGFGRISDFELVSRQQDSIEFALEWTEDTLKVYPWKFALYVSYELEENKIKVIWRVRNLDEKHMVFSIGAHGAFRCPIVPGEKFEDYYLAFNEAEDMRNLPLDSKGQFQREYGNMAVKGTKLPLNYEMFRNDALAYAGQKSTQVSLRSTKSEKSLTVEAKGFPYWGYWTPDKGGAPFLCIEPWHGHADYVDFAGDFKDREGSEELAPGEEKKFSYTIAIG